MTRTLHLNLHREFFAAVAARKKRIEYRAQSLYWSKRLEGRQYGRVHQRFAVNPSTLQGNKLEITRMKSS
jgi:hypothetical protein